MREKQKASQIAVWLALAILLGTAAWFLEALADLIRLLFFGKYKKHVL
jgi:hypothetical protein